MKNRFFFIVVTFFSLINVCSQDLGILKGKVIDKKSRENLPFVNVIVVGTKIGTTTDSKGDFTIKNVPLGYVKIRTSFVGYSAVVSDDYLVTKEKKPYIFIEMQEDISKLKEVVVRSKLFKKSVESPVSLQSLGIAEIEKNPGGNRDILKVIQSFPGVASNPGFRNDIIIRGGATSENKFYVDGIEVPVINHFQTQGATGGPVGIINADLIRKVDFYASAFPSNRGNALSSVIEFTQKTGSPEELNGRATLGTSDAGITLDGSIRKSTTFMFSVRQSYLQYLFKLIKLPFLPTYNDFQLNVKSKLSDKSELSIIALGAVDNFKLNEDVNEDITDDETIKRNRYILSNIPIQKQWNYTVGAKYKYYGEKSTQLFVFSRNEWSNNATKYFNNTNSPSDLILEYTSKEIENKFRYENSLITKGNYKINVGVGLENATYTNTTFNKIANSQGVVIRDFSSRINLFKYALFSQVSNNYLNGKLGLSVGIRMDAVSFNNQMKNPLNQFSPRFSTGYLLNDKWSWNSSIGVYYQLPSYTILGYRNNANVLVNKNDLKYIQSNHVVSGFEYKPNGSSKLTFEAFYKKYKNYPFSVRNQISLANLGADFGVIGSEKVASNSVGRSYGFELLAQKKSYKGLYGIASYTFVRSEFKDKVGTYIPSTWDNQHLFTITAGKKLKRNWEIGGKFGLVGGRPYTPYDKNASSIIANYDVTNRGILDYSKLNSERFSTFTQLDVRVDKTWYWKRFSLNFYIDVQNLLSSKSVSQSFLLPTLDTNGDKVIDPSDNSKYVLEELENSSGNVLPRFGFIVDF